MTTYNRRAVTGVERTENWFGFPVTQSPEQADKRTRPDHPVIIRPHRMCNRQAASKPATRPTRLPRSSGLVRPNAVCPAWGARVYFYSNEYGSRVYFGEVGPPWPKHSCTNNYGSNMSSGPASSRRSAPAPYSASVGRQLYSERVPRSVRRKAFTVVHATHSGDCTVLGLQPIYQTVCPRDWITARQVSVPVEQLVFVDNGSMSYTDEGLGEVVSVAVQQKRTAPREPFFERLRRWWNN